MHYKTYHERQQHEKSIFDHIGEVLVNEFNLTPEQAINVTHKKPLVSGSVAIDHWGADLSNGKDAKFPLRNDARFSIRIMFFRTALLHTFSQMPPELKEAVKARQKYMLDRNIIQITPKLANYKPGWQYTALLERQGMMPVRNWGSHMVPPLLKDDHGKAWKACQEAGNELELDDLSETMQHRLRKVGLTCLALHLTKLQLINQCLK